MMQSLNCALPSNSIARAVDPEKVPELTTSVGNPPAEFSPRPIPMSPMTPVRAWPLIVERLIVGRASILVGPTLMACTGPETKTP